MPIKIVTGEEMQEIEKKADAGGLSFEEMMDNAGRAVADTLQEWVGASELFVLILVGPGNNGGDGLVAARYLADKGASVHLYAWERITANDDLWDLARASCVSATLMEDDKGRKTLRKLLGQADVVVDALLGTGQSGPIKGKLKNLLDAVEESISSQRQAIDGPICAPAEALIEIGAPVVVAIDLPTGLDCDSGAVDPATIRADMTVALAGVKPGHILAPAVVGKLVVADIGIPDQLFEDANFELASPAQVANWLQEIGTADADLLAGVLVVAGSVPHSGSAFLASISALRVGSGQVTVGLPQPIYPIVAAQLVEAEFLLLPHDMGMVSAKAIKLVTDAMGGAHRVFLLGPGLGQEKATAEFCHQLLGGQKSTSQRRVGFLHQEAELENGSDAEMPPLVLAGDGPALLADVDQWWQLLPSQTIVICTLQQLAALVGRDVDDTAPDRFALVCELATTWGQVVVLNECPTLIAAPDGRLVAQPFDSPVLSAAGSDAVLAGAVAGLRAQGLAAFEAAVAGCFLHGLAGELARDSVYELGLTAGDLPAMLPLSLARLRGLG